MEKKVYKVKQHEHKTNEYRLLLVAPRRDDDDRRDAIDAFVDLANERLCEGCDIIHITHAWNYEFQRPDGSRFNLYMFEDSEIVKY